MRENDEGFVKNLKYPSQNTSAEPVLFMKHSFRKQHNFCAML